MRAPVLKEMKASEPLSLGPEEAQPQPLSRKPSEEELPESRETDILAI